MHDVVIAGLLKLSEINTLLYLRKMMQENGLGKQAVEVRDHGGGSVRVITELDSHKKRREEIL